MKLKLRVEMPGSCRVYCALSPVEGTWKSTIVEKLPNKTGNTLQSLLPGWKVAIIPLCLVSKVQTVIWVCFLTISSKFKC